jgi:hypothetical protein
LNIFMVKGVRFCKNLRFKHLVNIKKVEMKFYSYCK